MSSRSSLTRRERLVLWEERTAPTQIARGTPSPLSANAVRRLSANERQPRRYSTHSDPSRRSESASLRVPLTTPVAIKGARKDPGRPQTVGC